MKKSDYLKSLEDALANGRISVEAYDAGIMNLEVFCEEDDEEDDENT